MIVGTIPTHTRFISPVLQGLIDPNLSTGVSSTLGWIYVNTVNATLWHKTGSGNTDWTKLVDFNINPISYQGVIDCSSNPNYPSATLGQLWFISVAGKIGGTGGVTVEVGDLIICKVTSSPSGDQSAVGTNWDIIQTNISQFGDLTSSSPISITSGSGAVIGQGTEISIPKADGSQDGYLAKEDWTKFNSSSGGGTNISSGTLSGNSPIIVNSGSGAVIGGGSSIAIQNAKADGITKGAAIFTAADFNDDNNGLISIDYVNGQQASLIQKGFVQLSSSYSGTLQSLAVTEKALSDGLATKQNVSAELTGISNLVSNGILARIGTGAFRAATITGTANRLLVTDGDGVAGDPTLNMDPNLFPSPGAGDLGKILTAAGANVTNWSAVIGVTGGAPTKRQTVLSGGVDSTGKANFLYSGLGTGLSVSLSGSTANPIVMSWSNGFGTTPDNYQAAYTSNQLNLFSSLKPCATNFLYIDNDGTGTLTSGSTVYRPVYDTVFNSTDAQVMLAPFEGTNGATAYTDSYGKVWTLAGSAKLSNAQKLYNPTTSLELSTSYVQTNFPDIKDSSNSSTGVTSWTLEVFIRPTDATAAATQTIFCGGDARYTFNLGITTAGKLIIYISSNGTSFDIASGISGNSTLSDGTWYHIAMVYNNNDSTLKVYLNGTEETLMTLSGVTSIMTPYELRVGATYTGNTLYFVGYMEGLRYSPYARYTANFIAPTTVFTVEELHYFDINKMTMYKGQPGNWTKTYRLFIGEAATNLLSVILVSTYAINGKCIYRDSTIPANGSTTIFVHNIGCGLRYQASLKLKCVAYDAPFYPNLVITVFGERFAAASYQNFNGSTFSSLRRNYVFKTVGVYGTAALDYGGSTVNITTASWRYIFTAERDF